MAKYQEITDLTQEKFDKVLETTGIPEFITFKLLHNEKQKEPITIVKASEVFKYINKIDVLVFINETMFDKLDTTPIFQTIIIEEALAQVYYDSEKDKLTMIKPDLVTFSGILGKYKNDYLAAFECVKTLKGQKENGNEQGE